MLLELEMGMILKLILALILGSLIGYEREIKTRPAGLRTHILVCMGSALFTILSINAFPSTADPSRVASYVVMGIGFIGAGTILQTRKKVIGLTTAASLWVTASIGMAIGTGFYFLAIITAFAAFVVLSIGWVEKGIRKR